MIKIWQFSVPWSRGGQSKGSLNIIFFIFKPNHFLFCKKFLWFPLLSDHSYFFFGILNKLLLQFRPVPLFWKYHNKFIHLTHQDSGCLLHRWQSWNCKIRICIRRGGSIIDSFACKFSKSKEWALGHQDPLTYRHVLSELVLFHLHKKRTILTVAMTTVMNVRKATTCFIQYWRQPQWTKEQYNLGTT